MPATVRPFVLSVHRTYQALVPWGGPETTPFSSVPASAVSCAARVLSDFYDRVTVYERDELPDGPANRAAVPQGRHVHLLMARGAAEFDTHFPGLLDDMVADGVPDTGEPTRLHSLRSGRTRTGHGHDVA